MTPIPAFKFTTLKNKKYFQYSEQIKFQVKIFSNKGQFAFVTNEAISQILSRCPYITFRVKIYFPYFKAFLNEKKANIFKIGKYMMWKHTVHRVPTVDLMTFKETR